jgi:hypothetical protein
VGRLLTLSLGLFAAAVFVASLVVHVLSLVPGTAIPFERVVWLHGLALLAFIATAVHASTSRNRVAHPGRSDTEELTRHAPPLVWGIGAVLFVYAIFNFAYFMATVEGQADVRDGHYVLMNRSVVIREISEAEYHQNRRLHARGVSGHWMMFSWVAVAYFLFVAPRVREEQAATN